MQCDGCSSQCKREYPFRRCAHDMRSLFVCPEFGRLTWVSCGACENCPGKET